MHLELQHKENTNIIEEYKELLCNHQDKRREELDDLKSQNVKNINKLESLYAKEKEDEHV